MTKRRLSIAVISTALALCGCTKTPNPKTLEAEAKLVGEWQAPGGVSFVFNRDHSFRITGNSTVDQITMLGAKFEWRIDASHDPIWLDVIATSMGKQQVFPAIAHFITDQKLIVRMPLHVGGSRPADFGSTPEDAKGLFALVKAR